VHSVDLEVVHQDSSKAHAWLNLAPTLGDNDLIQVRNEVASYVTSEQFDEASKPPLTSTNASKSSNCAKKLRFGSRPKDDHLCHGNFPLFL